MEMPRNTGVEKAFHLARGHRTRSWINYDRLLEQAGPDRLTSEQVAKFPDQFTRSWFDDPDNEYARMAREQYDVSINLFRDDAIEALEQLNALDSATESNQGT